MQQENKYMHINITGIYLSLNKVWFSSFIFWYINFCGLFNAKAILVEEQ